MTNHARFPAATDDRGRGGEIHANHLHQVPVRSPSQTQQAVREAATMSPALQVDL